MNMNYIGITGFCFPEEIKYISQVFGENGTHELMIGVLLSYKTLKFGRHPTNRRYPSLEKIKNLMIVGQKHFTAIHYNTRKKDFSKEIQPFFDAHNIYDYCNAVQLNILNPEWWEISLLRYKFPSLKFILQLNDSFLKLGTKLTDKLTEYYYDVDYVLIDPSRGRGKDFDLDFSVKLFKTIKKEMNVNVGFAGGFSHKNVYRRIKKLAKRLNTIDFSIDAEGNLRTDTNLLDLESAENYVLQAKKAFAEFK